MSYQTTAEFVIGRGGSVAIFYLDWGKYFKEVWLPGAGWKKFESSYNEYYRAGTGSSRQRENSHEQ